MRTHTPVELKHPDCQLNTEPFFQCCCTCIYLWPVHHHCGRMPEPTEEEKKEAGVEGRCICGVQKKTATGELNWACVAPEFGRVHDNWGQHSCGCELHTTKEQKAKWDSKKT
jgi:hypothetical protein